MDKDDRIDNPILWHFSSNFTVVSIKNIKTMQIYVSLNSNLGTNLLLNNPHHFSLTRFIRLDFSCTEIVKYYKIVPLKRSGHPPLYLLYQLFSEQFTLSSWDGLIRGGTLFAVSIILKKTKNKINK